MTFFSIAEPIEPIPVVIFCGGQGTRMRGDTLTKKELVEVGGLPIIWHVMRIFSAQGYNHFILTLGYQADQLRRYFLEYEAMSRDLTLELGNGRPHRQFHCPVNHPPWHVTLADTGRHTEKAGRLARIVHHLTGERFFVAYGDDVSDIDLHALLAFHRRHGRLATVTAVQIPLPYGVIESNQEGLVSRFVERPCLPYWINGGFMLLERPVLDLIATTDNANLETELLPELARQGELMVYRHTGFWKSMNTFKDTLELEQLWQEGAPWKIW